MKAATTLVTARSLGIHIFHFEGFSQAYLFCGNAGDQTGGGGRGSRGSSLLVSKPISDRLKMECRLVIAVQMRRTEMKVWQCS
jgi:hypothetical protein